MARTVALAVDLGASGGRVVSGAFDGRLLELAELHRFENAPVKMGGDLVWDLVRLWNEILGRLHSQMTKATFATGLSPSRLTGCQDSTLLVTVPNCYVQEWLEHRLHGVIQRALNDFLGDGWQVRFVSADEEQEGKKV